MTIFALIFMFHFHCFFKLHSNAYCPCHVAHLCLTITFLTAKNQGNVSFCSLIILFTTTNSFLGYTHQETPICLFVKISYKLVSISNGQADFDLLLNNKLKLASLCGWKADLNLFL